MLRTLSRHREPHFRPGPLVGPAGIDMADVDMADVDMADVELLLREVADLVRPVAAAPEGTGEDIVDEWGMQSFPASDPPANW